MTKLLKKGMIWKWQVVCQTAYDELKKMMIKGPVLKLVDVSKSFEVEIDASDLSLEGIVTQEGHPIA